MASTLHRDVKWATEAPADKLLTVMRALEPQIVASASTIPQLESKGYYISTPQDSMHGLVASDLAELETQDAIINTIEVTHDNFSLLTQDGYYRFSLWVQKSFDAQTAEVELKVTAPRTNEASALIDNTFQRVKAEINRQNEANWQAIPLELVARQRSPVPDDLSALAHQNETIGLTKRDKARVVKRKVRRGPILQEELNNLLETASEGATSTSISVNWRGGDDASAKSIAQVRSIEDAAGVRYIRANFTYEDRSTLTIRLDCEFDFEFEATGQIARQRLSSIDHYWATIPGRSRFTMMFIQIASRLLAWVALYVILALVYAAFSGCIPCVLLWSAVLLAFVCIVAFLWSTPSGRARYRLIVPMRRRIDPLKLVSAIAGSVAAVAAVLAYLFPRK